MSLQRPEQVDERSWDVFMAVVRDGRTLREISGRTGLSIFRLRQIISRVDRKLDPPGACGDAGLITPDSRIEELGLSTRACNALRQVGCVTVQNVLDGDFTRAVRSFGEGTRKEVATALSRHGFTPPPALEERKSNLEALARDLRRLRQTIEEAYRASLDQLARFEAIVRKLARP